MSFSIRFFAIFVYFAISNAEEARYDNYRVHRVIPKNAKQLELLRNLQNTHYFPFWTDLSVVGSPVDIMVPPHLRPMFSDYVKRNHLTENVTIPNVQKQLDTEKESMRAHETRRFGRGMDWNNYYSLDDIYNWLKDQAAKHPEIQVLKVGKTYEGRDILAIQITNGENFPGVILEAGMHAREWIAPAATSWVVNKIINSSPDSIFKKFNYIYIPITNPDGYEYSRNNDRLWRKTRTPYMVNMAGLICYGADPNRNFDHKWGTTGVALNDPCSDNYPGPAPFSEVTIRTYSEFLRSIAQDYDIYISFHNYAQTLMYPWGYIKKDTPMEPIWKRVTTKAVKAIKAVHGTEFEAGSIAKILYSASGCSVDWYYKNFNSTIAFAFELRDKGFEGFALPSDQIIPSGQELLPAIKTILKEYKKIKA